MSNCALVPTASALPHVPLPAYVVTAPPAPDTVESARTLHAVVSEMYSGPEEEALSARPLGARKVAAVAEAASVAPATPEPARVVTTPAAVMARMRKLPRSAMRKLPSPRGTIEDGQLNSALVPVPSAKPWAPPASVATTPEPLTVRTRLPLLSSTSSAPPCSARPWGRLKRADRPLPSSVAAVPSPAMADTRQ